MPVLPNNTLVVSIYVETNFGQWSNVLYYEPASAIPANQDMVALADALFEIFAEKYAPVLSEDAFFAGVKARYHGTGVDIEGYSTSEAVPGTAGGQQMPDQDCLEVRRLTGLPGRKNRGRIFVSGISENLQEDGKVITGQYSTIQTFAESFSTDITGSGITLHARHWNRVDNLMKPITVSRPLVRLVSRRDRAKRLPYQAI